MRRFDVRLTSLSSQNMSIRRKPFAERTRTNNKLSPHMTPSAGIEPGPHWWEASALTTAPSPRHPAIPATPCSNALYGNSNTIKYLKSFEYSITLSPSLMQILPPCLKVCFNSSGSSSGSNSSPTFSNKT